MRCSSACFWAEMDGRGREEVEADVEGTVEFGGGGMRGRGGASEGGARGMEEVVEGGRGAVAGSTGLGRGTNGFHLIESRFSSDFFEEISLSSPARPSSLGAAALSEDEACLNGFHAKNPPALLPPCAIRSSSRTDLSISAPGV